ncbi:PLP-dependent transferase, partial [Cutaneotrichosporon oleaginosum]
MLTERLDQSQSTIYISLTMPSSETVQTFQLFAYGTLMVPAILLRVLGRKGEDLKFQDAILHGYTRHHVKDADYPGLIGSEKLAELGADAGDNATRGTLVSGLTPNDMRLLDVFEGDEYERVTASVAVLSEAKALSDLPAELVNASHRTASKEIRNVTALTYAWAAPVSRLEKAQWSFDEFLRDKAAVWAGTESEFAEVEAAQDEIVGAKVDGFPDFGHNMKQYWPFAKSYVNMNHGSYGSPPLCVIEAKEKLSRQMDARIDTWMRRRVEPLFDAIREEVAPLLGTVGDNVVLVQNTTHGVNTIAYNLKYEPGDIIVVYASTYNAVSQMMKHVCDTHEGVRIEVVNTTFPCAHSDIVEATEAVLKKYNKPVSAPGDGPVVPQGVEKDERVRVVVVDSIASLPGVVYPWEDVTRLCHKYGALSLVDGAHSIGQHTVDVTKADPDFFVSNLHKWLFTHRASAIMYVAPRNQALIRTTFPTGHYYESDKYPTTGYSHPWAFAKQFGWSGTGDFTPYLTVPVALKFRREIGGEERIMAYNHSMAVAGGKRLAKRWSTSIIENERGELTACMANVELPIAVPKDISEQIELQRYMEDTMLEADTFASTFVHNGKWFGRFSAQVWTELSDFDYVGDVYDKIAEGVRRGEHLQERS